ncbi:glycoside hydrolase superfamily [Aspergillus ambiguus]|uniref:class III chitinase ChiA1 n=1 Tax=Aspergillus ambiguus TaxID=176160 RepID=UPI003CCD5E3A
MVSSKTLAVATALSTVSPIVSAFDAQSKTNVAVYYGQGANQPRLSEFCADTSLDIINIGFVNIFPDQGALNWPGSNFGNQCDGTTYEIGGASTQLLSGCHQIAEDIPICQAAGKKVFLSLGGAYPDNQAILSENTALAFADFLWLSFGPVNQSWVDVGGPRPFRDVSVDGFDFDIEHNGGFGYADMVNRLREHYAEVPDRTFYISGAPQCMIPDAQLSDAIANSPFDFVWVQFYNTAGCSAMDYVLGNTPGFNYDAWVDVIKKSANPKAKLLVGLPASETVVNAGYYLTPEEVQPLVCEYMDLYPDTFGGIMLWEATASEQNQINGTSYADNMKKILDFCAPIPTTPSSSTVIPSSTAIPSSSSIPSSSPVTTKTPTSTPVIPTTTRTRTTSSRPVIPTTTRTPTQSPSSSPINSPSSSIPGSSIPGSSAPVTPSTTTTPGQSTTTPGQSATTTPGQSGTTAPGQSGTTTTAPGTTSAPVTTPTTTSPASTTDTTTYTTVIVTSYTSICPTGFTTITTTYTTTYCPGNTATATATQPPSGPGPQTSAPPPPEGWTTTVTVCTQCAATPTTVTLTLPAPTTGAPVVPTTTATLPAGYTTTVTVCTDCGPAPTTVTVTVPIIEVPTTVATKPTGRPIVPPVHTKSRPLILGTGGVRPSSSTMYVRPSSSVSRAPVAPTTTPEGVSPVFTGAAPRAIGLGQGAVALVGSLLYAFLM